MVLKRNTEKKTREMKHTYDQQSCAWRTGVTCEQIKGEVAQMKEEEEEEKKKTYKQPVLFLRKSKAGKHLYAFNREEEGVSVLGEDVGSILMDVAEVEKVLEGKSEWCKIGVIPVRIEGD